MFSVVKFLLLLLLPCLLIVHVIYRLIARICISEKEDFEESHSKLHYVKPLISALLYLFGFYSVIAESFVLVVIFSVLLMLLFVADLLNVILERSVNYLLVIDLSCLIAAATFAYLLNEDLPFNREA